MQVRGQVWNAHNVEEVIILLLHFFFGYRRCLSHHRHNYECTLFTAQIVGRAQEACMDKQSNRIPIELESRRRRKSWTKISYLFVDLRSPPLEPICPAGIDEDKEDHHNCKRQSRV